MAITYSLDQLGVKIRIKVTDCLGDTAFDRDQIADQFIVFVKPDGSTFEKQANLIVDTSIPAESFIEYHNTTPETSIWDLKGEWEYTGKVTLTSSDVAQMSQKRVAWVV